EEMGLILAVCCVIAILLLALFAVKEAATARSSFYVIAACATAMIFVVQTMLNVFGSTDLLPLTGVTLPFVSCGGSSMISCWALLAYIKASDTRQNSGLAVRLPKRARRRRSEDVPPEEYWEEPPAPPQNPEDGPIIPEDEPLYTDADNWQQYFQWEEDDP
ncbi:MAG: FtsW/RodA/SpoVE family cell cycle protein, partial [Candidatus Onthomonas sp.]|nr:FtsW/RodA/SpoVE family cell cycle protein [Candidatus Onthomonas sp.]